MDEQPNTSEASDEPLRWLEEHGDVLFGFALRRVHRPEVAEDLVQDTLLAGFQSYENFDRRSAVRTWLVGILKNKVVDYFRREVSREAKERRTAEAGHREPAEPLFKRNGQWIQRLASWSTQPVDHLERAEFWLVFEHCMGQLPATLKAVFVLREVDGIDTETTCEQLGISSSNASVRLYRARIYLRTCLERNWFHGE